MVKYMDICRICFNLFRHYIVNGVNGYMYWNAVLEPKGMSTWGWEQNSMIIVNPETKEVMYNPEFYVMKHFSHFVQKGAKRLTTSGVDSVDTVAFKNPDESIIIVISNKMIILELLILNLQVKYLKLN